jgi:hypothetical protein
MLRNRWRVALVGAIASVIVAMIPSAASASVPSSTAAEGTFMVNGPVVNDILVVGGRTWIGGSFSQVLDDQGDPGASASNLTVFDSSGQLDTSLHGNWPNLSGTASTIYDLSLGPNGVLYVGGKFSYSVGGRSYKNLIGISPITGNIVAAFRAHGLKSVLATATGVYGGGVKLKRFSLLGGNADPLFHQMTVYLNTQIRGHATTAGIREIEELNATELLVVGAFDWIDGQDADHEKKVAVRVNALTGEPQLGPGSWSLQCQCARQESAAFGLALDVAGDIVYVAAGGNDWIGAFRVADGTRIWQTDTNGSAQDLAVYDDTTLIVGGHWTFIEDDGPSDDSGAECPARNVRDPAPCWAQARLAAISRTNGLPDTAWTPRMCCLYRGTWAITVDGTSVHVGGEFTSLDDATGPERFYGRFDAT